MTVLETSTAMPIPVESMTMFPTGFTPQGESDFEVIELPLLLPAWQVVALESAARERGMTVGQFLRRLLTTLLPRS